MDKRKLIDAIIASLERELAVILQSFQAAHEAATNEESKAEDPYDTRGLEASYLAGAQASRAAELKQLVAAFRLLPVRVCKSSDPIEPGALIELDLEGKRSVYFLASQGGGVAVVQDGRRVLVLTPQAPLGEALLGRRLGDWVEIEAQGVTREYEIVAVS